VGRALPAIVPTRHFYIPPFITYSQIKSRGKCTVGPKETIVRVCGIQLEIVHSLNRAAFTVVIQKTPHTQDTIQNTCVLCIPFSLQKFAFRWKLSAAIFFSKWPAILVKKGKEGEYKLCSRSRNEGLTFLLNATRLYDTQELCLSHTAVSASTTKVSFSTSSCAPINGDDTDLFFPSIYLWLPTFFFFPWLV